MSQALHIFKKDARYLRLEISLFVLVVAMFSLIGFRNRDGVDALLVLAGAYLIARLIHAESIPGDDQFWISRPYRWKSLLGAKISFVLVFVNLPIFVAQFALLLWVGFPLAAILPGLLWSQFLMVFAASIPIAVLASMTSGLVPFIFTGIVLLLLLAVAAGDLSVWPWPATARMQAEPVQWLWDSALYLIIGTGAMAILCLQYKKRRTAMARLSGIAVLAAAAALYLYVPWRAGFALETRFSGHPASDFALHVSLNESEAQLISTRGYYPPRIELLLPLTVTGYPEGVDLQEDALSLRVRNAEGREWRTGAYTLPPVPKIKAEAGKTLFRGDVTFPNDFFAEKRQERVSLRGSMHVTLFGRAKSKTVALGKRPVNTFDGLQCAAGPIKDLYCLSPFRWPERLINAEFPDGYRRTFAHTISYSPFPAELGFNTVDSDSIWMPAAAREVTFVEKEPLGHIRLDFDFPNIKLIDERQ